MNDDAFWTRLDRYLAGDATPEERAEVERWVAESPARAELLASLRAVGGQGTWDTDAAWLHMTQQMGQAAQTDLAARRAEGTVRNARSAAWLKAAALAALLIGGMVTWRLISSSAGETAIAEVSVTAAGQRDTVNLPDGSIVVLAPESRIESRYTAAFRQIRLAGEAFFDVVSEPGRPFRVETGTALTEVLGTEFNVRARTDTSTSWVVVREGRVSVRSRNNGDSVVLAAGQVGLASADSVTVLNARADRWLAWLEGDLEFDNAPLTEVIAELERWFDTDVRLADAALAARRVSGRFNAESVEDVLRALELTLAVQARQDSAGWSIHNR
jgi:transmembrane sensor